MAAKGVVVETADELAAFEAAHDKELDRVTVVGTAEDFGAVKVAESVDDVV